MGDVISLSAYARGPGAGMHLAPGEDVLRLRPRQLDGARSPAAKVGTAPHRVPVRWFLRPLPEGAERRMALWCAAALLALAALSGALSCSPARAAHSPASLSTASRAASCSACFLLRPVPLPSSCPSTTAATE